WDGLDKFSSRDEPMKRLRFVMIGGFLGAGKTTTMARLARHYLGRGQRIGLVTNDQAQDLVDTQSLRAQGFPVEEVAGAGFCSGFSPKAAYIFTKQLEEADAIVLNRIDEIAPDAVQEVADLVSRVYPGTPVLRLSAKTGQGFEALTELLDQQGPFGRKILTIDY